MSRDSQLECSPFDVAIGSDPDLTPFCFPEKNEIQ
jgi:hypothetical protein